MVVNITIDPPLGLKRRLKRGPSTVLRLFDLTLQLIADNAKEIESLYNFPSQVGEQIFDKVTHSGKLAQSTTPEKEQLQIWKKFCAAYGDMILPTVDLSYGLLVINEYLDPLSVILEHVVELNLSYCSLGPCHDIIFNIAHIKQLKILLLRKNGLTDITIQKMTMPLRKFDSGPHALVELDLSGNSQLTDKTITWLSGFKKLEKLNMSGTLLSKQGCEALMSKYSLYPCNEERYVTTKIDTTGWAKLVIKQWKEILEERRKRRSRPLGQYSMCRGRRLFVQMREEITLPPEPEEEKLLFMKIVNEDHVVALKKSSCLMEGLKLDQSTTLSHCIVPVRKKEILGS